MPFPIKHGDLVKQQKAVDQAITQVDQTFTKLVEASRAFAIHGIGLRRQRKSTKTYLRWRLLGGATEYVQLSSTKVQPLLEQMNSEKLRQLFELERERIQAESERQVLAAKRERYRIARDYLDKLKQLQNEFLTNEANR